MDINANPFQGYGMGSSMIIFDLFSGTRSATRAFEQAGHTVISFELSPKHWATETVDVMDLDAKDLIAKYGQPDFVWASPPCTTFSVASGYKYWQKTPNGTIPKHPDVAVAIELVRHTLNLIKELNPIKGWLMENPRGMLRLQDVVKDIPRTTITYCQYGDFRMKPTDLWGIVPGWIPRQACKAGDGCHEAVPKSNRTAGSTRLSRKKRSMIPDKLGLEILNAIS